MGDGFGGGFGNIPGVRETKVVGAPTEVVIPTQQGIAIWIATTLLLFGVYIFAKIWITSRGDWSLTIGILTIIGIPVGLLYADRFLQKFFYRIYFDMGRTGFIVCVIIALTVAFFVLDFYVTYIVPQMVYAMNEQCHVIFLMCVLFAYPIAYRPHLTFMTRQLTDSLRDSDSRYAIRSLEIANERENSYFEEEDDTPEVAPWNAPALLRTNSKAISISPAERSKLAITEFLQGLVDEKWTTSETSWPGKKLKTSGYNVSSVGNKIRDTLIQAGWAEWVHPESHNQGWRLLVEPGQIQDMINLEQGLDLNGGVNGR